jgi:hypothetical protein
VARGHHVAGLLVGAIADLEARRRMVSGCSWFPAQRVPAHLQSDCCSLSFCSSSPSKTQKEQPRTEGIARLPLNRLRTRLSIPLGLRHAESKHLNRSLWWRMKRLVPANRHARQRLCPQNPSATRNAIIHLERRERSGKWVGAVNRWETGARGTYASSRSGCASWRQPSVRLVRIKLISQIQS